MSKFLTRHCFSAITAVIIAFWAFPLKAVEKEVFVCAQTCTLSQTPKPDGSRGHPWPTITEALADAQDNGGDTVNLLSGHYGHVMVSNRSFRSPVTIQPAPGADAHFETLDITNSENIVFRGLKIWPIGPPPQNQPLIRTTTSAKNITFLELELRGHETARNYMRWSKDTWLKYSISGIVALGPNTTIQRNIFWGLSYPITTMGAGANVISNTIKGFSGDGMRGLGDNSTFAGNRLQDCVKTDANHDDGFQSWSLPPGQGVITGLTVERNMILEWTGRKSHPLRCTLQGIGLFDGTYKDLIIRNNVVAVSAYHGISVYGGNNVNITHNTVVSTFGDSTGSPWIMVSPHKNGTPSRRVVLANNLAMSYNLLPPFKSQFNPILNANMLIRHPFGIFKDPKRMDFRLKSTSSAKGAGRTELSTPLDITGRQRPLNQQPDVGAYQSE